VDELFAEIDRYYAAGKTVVRDEQHAAEARVWLASNVDPDAMTPERMAALEAEAARTQIDEEESPVDGRRFSGA
jgi:(E)-4-hydroxy-3-methylbut-2-enyl-diphosphate synthase